MRDSDLNKYRAISAGPIESEKRGAKSLRYY